MQEKDKALRMTDAVTNDPPKANDATAPASVAPPPPPQEPVVPEDDRSTLEKVRDTAVRGLAKVGTETLDMIGDVGDAALDAVGLDEAGDKFNEVMDAPDNAVDKYIPKVEGTGFAIAESVITFGVAFALTGGAATVAGASKVGQAVKGASAVQKIAKGTDALGKAGKFAKFTAGASAKGAVVDFSTFDPMETGLAELAANSNVPGLSDLGNALSVHDTDSRLEARFKRTGEGAILGVGADLTFYAVRGVVRGRMANRMVKAIERGDATPSDVIKRDLKLAEGGQVTDPLPAQASSFRDKDGALAATLRNGDDGGWELVTKEGFEKFDTIDDALKSAKKGGLKEESLAEAADRYAKAAEGDLRPLQELSNAADESAQRDILKKLGFKPEEEAIIKNADTPDYKPTPKEISDFERNLDKTVSNIKKSLENPDATPAGLRKVIEDFPMNWKHYLGRDAETSAPLLLVSRLFKKSKITDEELGRLVAATLDEGGVSASAKLQVQYLRTLNQHEPALNVLIGQAVTTAQGKRLSDLTGKIRHAASVGADETVHSLRKVQRDEFRTLVNLQKEYADYIAGIGRGLRANRLRGAMDEAVLRGQEAGSIFQEGVEKNLEDIGAQFETVPFKEAEDWINAMSDDEILHLGELIELSGGKAPDFAELIKRSRVLSGNEEGLSKMAYLWQATMEWQTAGLLSGGRTWTKILGSNDMLKTYEMVVAPAVGAAMPVKGLSLSARKAMVQEAGDSFYGLVRFAGDGLKAAGAAWKHNLPVADPYVVRQFNQVPGLKKLNQLPFRVINTLDTYAKVTVTRTRARTDALKKARASGLSPAEATEYAERMAKASIDSRTGIILYEPGRKLGSKIAMMSPMNEGEAAKALMDMVHKVPIMQPFVKFLRPAASLLAYTAEHVPFVEKLPLGLSKRIRQELAEGGPEAVAKLRAKRFTALSTMTVLGGGYAAGSVTAAGPSDPALRKEWLRHNKPYSVKVNGKWRNYLWLPGYGPLIGMFTSAMEATEYGLDKDSQAYSNVHGPEILAHVAGTMVSSLMEQSYLQGVVNFAEFLTADDPSEMRRSWRTLSRGFMFAPMTQMLTHDPHIRDAQSLLEDFRANIPGLSRTLPPKYDAFGEPIGSYNKNIIEAIDPFKSQAPPDKDLTAVALEELNVGLNPPSRLYKGKTAFDMHDTEKFGEWNGQSAWTTFNQVLRGEWQDEKGETYVGLNERITKIIYGPEAWEDRDLENAKYRAVVDADYRKEQMALGNLSDAEYAKMQKKLYARILEAKSRVYDKALRVLTSSANRSQARYPKLDAEIGDLIRAERDGQTRFLD